MASKHPEQHPDEVFLGNFTPADSDAIGWKTKRPGVKAFCLDGSPYPFQEQHGVWPWFAKAAELQAAGGQAAAFAAEQQ